MKRHFLSWIKNPQFRLALVIPSLIMFIISIFSFCLTSLYTVFGVISYIIGVIMYIIWYLFIAFCHDNPRYNIVTIETTEDLDNIVPDEEINKIINK
jgi:hypothetical protein